MFKKVNHNQVLFNKLNHYFKDNIKLSIRRFKYLIIATKENMFYCIDIENENIPSFIINDDTSVIEGMRIKDLCHKRITDLYMSYYCDNWYPPNHFYYCLVRNEYNIYYYDMKYGVMKEYISQELIIDMCCGYRRLILLTQSGKVYECKVHYDELAKSGKYIHFKLKSFNSPSCENDKIKMISCSDEHSLALTQSGYVFGWGSNWAGQLGADVGHSREPIIIELNDLKIQKISCGYAYSLLLSCDGDIYALGQNVSGEVRNGTRERQRFPIKLELNIKFIDIASHSDPYPILMSQSIDGIYYVWGWFEGKNVLRPQSTTYQSFEHILRTNNTTDNLKMFDKLIEFEDSFLRNGSYSKHFQEINQIGRGSFGSVVKVKSKKPPGDYSAVKRIEFTSDVGKDEIIREYLNYKIMTRNYYNNEYLVKHFDAWFEENQSGFCLFIHMELCDKTLDDVIKEFNKDSHLKTNGTLTPVGYYIASQIFIKILQGFNHLHTLNPPLIHLNLKPANILLKKHEAKGLCVKIASFGLMTKHEFPEQEHTQGVGAPKYIEPEVSSGKYDTKADIYSLGVIFQNLFALDTYESCDQNKSLPELLKNKYNEAINLFADMCSDLPQRRPNCKEILDKMNSWALNEGELEINQELENIIASKERENEFTIYSILRSDKNSSSDSSSSGNVEGRLGALILKDNPKIFLKDNPKVLFNKLNHYFKDNIKLSIISSKCLIVVTKEDMFYCIDIENEKISSFIINDGTSVIEEMMVSDLCHKQINDLCRSGYFDYELRKECDYCLARSEYNVYWYDIKYGVMKEYISQELIIDMCCGDRNSVLLTQSGQVYEYEVNEDELINSDKYIHFKLKSFKNSHSENNKIKMISCGYWHSLALTQSGRVFAWGSNQCGQLGVDVGHSNEPIIIELNDLKIQKISCGYAHSLLLSCDGDIYAFGCNDFGEVGNGTGKEQRFPIKLELNNKFIDISIFHHISMSQSIDGIYYVWGSIEDKTALSPQSTIYHSFQHILRARGMNDMKKFDKLVEFEDPFVRNEHYSEHFQRIDLLGRGAFGSVFKVQIKEDSDYYGPRRGEYSALKRIELIRGVRKNEIIREYLNYKIMTTDYFRNEYLVEHFDAWFEEEIVSSQTRICLHIQMELCDKTLKDVIKEFDNDSHLKINETLTPVGYFIASQIFIQTLQGVNHLHTQNPPLIHRDIKPDNILLKKCDQKGVCVKIADFGLIAIHKLLEKSYTMDKGMLEYTGPEVHKFSGQSHTTDIGTPKYTAPEVIKSKKYDIKADVYSLGEVWSNLLELAMKSNDDYQDISKELKNKYNKSLELHKEMASESPYERPNCEEILAKKNSWALNKEDFEIYAELKDIDIDSKCKSVKLYNEMTQRLSHKSTESTFYYMLKSIRFRDSFGRNGFYSKHFQGIKQLGRGSFASVFQVQIKEDSDHYEYYKEKGIEYSAIKRIEFTSITNEMREYRNRELFNNKQITIYCSNNENLVQHFDAWFEEEVVSSQTRISLFIQMELCDKTLDDVIKEYKNDSILKTAEALTTIGYYIASRIFIQILQGVDYLHSQRGEPIIHRDLNPRNILLKKHSKKGFCVKIADFGHIAIHHSPGQSHTNDKGTVKFIAPEVRSGRKYDTKANIYSLGVTFEELFALNLTSSYDAVEDLLKTKFQKSLELRNDMTAKLPSERPDCDQILMSNDLWALKEEEFKVNAEMREKIVSKIKGENIIFSVLKRKLNI